MKPGANTSLSAQERKPSVIPTSQSSPCLLREETLSNSFKRNYFSADDLHKQETFASQIPYNACGRSSTTALGLLLRSSVFRELLEKNPQASEESDSENTKNIAQAVSDESDGIPILVSSNGQNFGLKGPGPQYFNRDYS